VHLWDVRTGKELCRLPGHEKRVNDLAFSPSGKVLVTSGGFRQVLLWDTTTGKSLGRLGPRYRGCKPVGFTADGKRLAIQDWRGVSIWDLASRREVREP